MLNISQNTVVQFHYTLKDESGASLETTSGNEPVTYLHGHDNLLRGLESALEGRGAGDEVSVTLGPADAFGEPRDDSRLEVPVDHLMGATEWKPGMIGVVNTNHGQRQVTVMSIDGNSAVVDTNHPLAGKTLVFDLHVVDVREASKEEITHGHAHGPGGHHH